MRLIVLVFLSLAIALSSALPKPKKADADWWKTAIFYQVYPRSFKDGDNSGEGDLQGIIDKIDHFVEAGITAIWLSPIYKSPQVDSGYDISDFRDIDPKYGDMAKFDELVAKAHVKNLKLVMDFVPNHSSDQHDWFIKSEEGVEEFKDFYVWRDGAGAEKKPPNNWLSVWKGSAWEWSDKREQYYLHQFSKQQPDLNYANREVVKEMTETLKFWLDKNVDGFRIDAIPHLFETGFDDEPLSGQAETEEDEWNYLDHIHTIDQNATYEQIYKWRKFVDDYTEANLGDTRVLMTEAYTTLEKTMRYYGTAENPGAHFSFNFQLITDADKTSKAKGIVDQVNDWMKVMPSGSVPNWVIGNHDNHRVATRYGIENADGMNMVVMMLPGVAVTYNGEEIGMEDGEVTLEQCKDPSVCPEGGPDPSEDDFLELGRDFERTPFHWDDSNANAGFNEGKETWLPVSPKYVTNNLAEQMGNDKSHFSIYREIVKTVRPELKSYTQCDANIYNEDVLYIRRTRKEAEYSTILLFNTGADTYTVNLLDHFEIAENGITQVASGKSDYSRGDNVNVKSINLKAHDSVIFEVRNGATGASICLLVLGLAAVLKMLL